MYLLKQFIKSTLINNNNDNNNKAFIAPYARPQSASQK